MARTGRPPAAQKILRTCEHCGVQWEAYPSHGDRTKYCSRNCYHSARTGVPTKPKQIHATEAKNCERCGAEFFVGGKDHPVRTTRFCGRVCSKTAFWEAHKAAGSDIRRPDMKGVPKPALWAAPETKPCAWCKSPFAVGGSGRSREKTFCSRSCARRSMWADRASGAAPGLSIRHDPAREMTREEAGWFAGVFDGEGCVSYPHRNLTWKKSASISVANTNHELLERLVTVTGTGRITSTGRQDKPHHQPCWIWHCHGDNARKVLQQAAPFLIAKREAAEYALSNDSVSPPPIAPRNRYKQTETAPGTEPIVYHFNFNIMTFEGLIPCHGLMDPSPTIKILIDYPLTNPCTFEAKCPNPDGWTEVEFIEAVRMAYLEVYSLEEDPGFVPGMLNRARSEGPVGIWGHGIGDLFLEGAERQDDGTWKLLVGS